MKNHIMIAELNTLARAMLKATGVPISSLSSHGFDAIIPRTKLLAITFKAITFN